MEIPEPLRNNAFRFIVLPPKSKSPPLLEWQTKNNHAYDDATLLNHIRNGGNYGVMTGIGNLVVLDADNPELIKAVEERLPKTFTVKSNKGFHYYFICDLGKKIVLKQESGEGKQTHYGELQFRGQYVVAPNSIHPNGTVYTVERNLPIACIKKGTLLSSLSEFYTPEEDGGFDVSVTDTKDALNKPNMLQVLGNHVNSMQKRGDCLCGSHPVHGSQTGQNFHVNLKNNVWYCFRCMSGGDSLALIGVLEKIIPCSESKKGKIRGELFKKIIAVAKAKYGLVDTRWEGGIVSFVNYLDLAKQFFELHPYFYDKNKLWWFWDKEVSAWKMVDETDILIKIDKTLKTAIMTTRNQIRNEILEALRRIGRQNIPKDPKKTWIQFKDRIVDIETGEIFDSAAEYFFTNPLPYALGQSEETPTMDKIFAEWVNKEYVQTLYEIIAYCMLPDYPIHRAFCLIGSGSNGKSKFFGLLRKFIGENNCCSTDLDTLLESRFESAKLYKKLVCVMGETNLTTLRKTQRIKRLTGQDLMGFEFKNKMPFEDINYAKILLGSNSLPVTLDKTVGFYRRWQILDFPNEFPETIDILATIPEEEYPALALKSAKILSELLKTRKFSNEGTIEERREKYEEKSNPLRKFIKENCKRDVNGTIIYSEFTDRFATWLGQNDYRHMTIIEIGRELSAEGFERKTAHVKIDGKDTTYKVIWGLKWMIEGKSDTHDTDDTVKGIQSLIQENLIGKGVSSVSSVSSVSDYTCKKPEEVPEPIIHVDKTPEICPKCQQPRKEGASYCECDLSSPYFFGQKSSQPPKKSEDVL